MSNLRNLISIKRIKRRNNATFLEMLIVLAVLALIAGFVGINAAKAYRQQRFKSEVEAVRDTLRLAQELMLVANVGATVVFDQSKEAIYYRIETDELLPEKWKRSILQEKALKAVHVVNFDREGEEPGGPGELKIRFFSDGLLMDKGILRLSTAKTDEGQGTLTRYIPLPGYPAPIVSYTLVPEERDEAEDKKYTERMLQDIEA